MGGGPTPWDNLDYGPFFAASILATSPADNMTYKGLAVKLGKVKVNGEETGRRHLLRHATACE